MNVIIIQPPLVQLNTAYPAGAYLAAFFRREGCNATWYDLSIELFHTLFSSKGLSLLFAKSAGKALACAEQAQERGDDATASNIYRYISQRRRWISWIDAIVAILQDAGTVSGRELCHRFVFSPYAPRGMRMELFLDGLGREPTTDDARFLASMALADLADYITAVFDPEFSLVRYGESLTVNESSFSSIEAGLDAAVLSTFYEQVLDARFSSLSLPEDEKLLVCISVPFAGTFTTALYTARWFKKHYGSRVFISIGGGFVNTELRDTEERALASYIDAISYDRGYGSYRALLQSGLLQGRGNEKMQPLYKMRLFSAGNSAAGNFAASNFAAGHPSATASSTTAAEKSAAGNSAASRPAGNFTAGFPAAVTIAPLEHDAEAEQYEDGMTATLVPDYSGIDFSRYPRMLDDGNPMQRLWSDGAWLKAYLAHGCYWHRCAFCDTTLDYVSAYRMTHVQHLFDGLLQQAEQHGIYGIHFVDEAMPPAAAVQFAARNAASGGKLSFWGNVRFEKFFTRDVAEFLSFGGLTGVSAGIEIATGSGLDEICKGTDIDSIVGACCAFKEAGILVHAYMIYGYWQESDQGTIDSMETLRQFYAAGLLDSAFWHKFTLTRHSRVYAEWKQGKHPGLHPQEVRGAGIFASNCLHFEGEQKSQKFSAGLQAALQAWMHGQSLQKPVGKWFNFKVPAPSVPVDLVERAAARYEKRRDAAFAAPVETDKAFWLGGEVLADSRGSSLTWDYMGELHQIDLPAKLRGKRAKQLCVLLNALSPEQHLHAGQEAAAVPPEQLSFLRHFRGRGLVQLPQSLSCGK